MGALVDGASGWIARMTLPEGDEVPNEAAIRVLRQLEHEAERRIRGTLPPQRHILLHTAEEIRSFLAVNLALFKIENRLVAFDFAPCALRLDTRSRAFVQALNLFTPLLAVGREIAGDSLEIPRRSGFHAPLLVKLGDRGYRRLNREPAGLVRHHLVAPTLDFDELTDVQIELLHGNCHTASVDAR